VRTPDIAERARVVALPMRERFRGITVRELVLIESPRGWVEWSPFAEYDDAEAARWLASTLESGWGERGTVLRDAVRVNATVPVIPPEAVPDLLARFPGCRTAKVKVGGRPLADDVALVAAVREHLGAAGRVRVDVNGAWSVDEAETAIDALADLDLEYVEQPCATTDELGELRRRIAGAVRIAADESVRRAEDPLEVARLGAADIVIVKPQPLGGARRALEIAREAGLPVVVSSALESSVGLAAAVRFAAALPDFDLDHGLGTAALLAADVSDEPLLPENGALPVRDVSVSEERLEAFAAPPERADWWLDRLRRCLELVDGVGKTRG